MKQIPAWLPAAHILAFAVAWGLCVWLGLTFGAWIGWLTFAVMEFRAITAKAVDGGYSKGGAA